MKNPVLSIDAKALGRHIEQIQRESAARLRALDDNLAQHLASQPKPAHTVPTQV